MSQVVEAKVSNSRFLQGCLPGMVKISEPVATPARKDIVVLIVRTLGPLSEHFETLGHDGDLAWLIVLSGFERYRALIQVYVRPAQ